jgi:hypothetical protein
LTDVKTVKRAATAADNAVAPRGLPLRHSVGIFVLALATSLWFNFLTKHIDCVTACDASEYLRDAHGLQTLIALGPSFWWHAFTHTGDITTTTNALSGVKELSQGGAVFPLFIAACLSIGHAGAGVFPVIGQCLLFALSAVMLAFTTTSAFNPRAGLIAGILAAVYPGFVVNSGRLYSDLFAAVLFIAVVRINTRGFTKTNSKPVLFALGAILAALQLTRSVMVLLTVTSLAVTLFQQKQRAHRALDAAAVIAGLAVVLIPWCAFQQLACGKASVVVDRVGQYNCFIGNNTATQGWLSFPYPDGHGIEKHSLIQLTTASIIESPTRWLRLMLDKPLRLFEFPWNDFRVNIGPFNFAWQVALHQALLLLAFTGIPLAFVREKARETARGQHLARMYLCGTLALSLIYVLFITVPRYNLSGVAVMIVFAAAGADFIWRARKIERASILWLTAAASVLFISLRTELLPYLVALFPDPAAALAAQCLVRIAALALFTGALLHLIQIATVKQRPPATIAVALACALLAFTCMPVRAHGRWYEWRCPFSQAGQTITQTINLTPSARASASKKQSFLLVDANGIESLNGCKIQVNGTTIDAPILSGSEAVQNYSELRNEIGNQVHWQGEFIFDCMTQLVNASNADMRQWLLIPLPPQIFAGRPESLQITLTRTVDASPEAAIFGNYRTPWKEQILPAIGTYSWEKAFYGVENDCGLTDPRLDERVKTGFTNSKADLSPEPGLQTGAYGIHLLVPGLPEGDNAEKILHAPLAWETKGKFAVSRFSALPKPGAEDLWMIRLQGNAEELKRLQIALQLQRATQTLWYQIPWSSKAAPSLDCAFLLSPSDLPAKMQSLQIKCVSKEAEATTPQECSIDIWRLKTDRALIFKGYQVF